MYRGGEKIGGEKFSNSEASAVSISDSNLEGTLRGEKFGGGEVFKF